MQAVLEHTSSPFPSDPSSSVPLVLIHDGGGTSFQYFLLPPLDRELYTIANPYHDDGGRPDGGLPELAQSYVAAMKETLPPGPVLVGGWSFGGMLSYEVARLLHADPQLHVRGLLMIDSVCPWSTTYASRGRVRPSFRPTTSEPMKRKVLAAFDHARAMIVEWPRPAAFALPPTVLIRATESLPPENSPDGLQLVRDADGMLGWRETGIVTMREVINVPGDHFSMWADAKLDALSEHIIAACKVLEKTPVSTLST